MSKQDVMTISSLLRELQAIREKRGDLRVYVLDNDDVRLRPAWANAELPMGVLGLFALWEQGQ